MLPPSKPALQAAPAAGTQVQSCGGNAPPLILPTSQSATSACGSGLAANWFSHGLCSCHDVVFTGAFSIDSFSSQPTAAGATGASVGINGQLITTGVIDIGGSLIAAGHGPLRITSGGFNIDGNFETNSDVSLTGANIRFGRDLWVNGDLNVIGLSRVRGDVYQTPGHAMNGTQLDGKFNQRTFTVPEPCGCGANQLLDIEEIVHQGIAASGAPPASSFNVGTGGTMSLGCGSFAYRNLNILGLSTIEVDGHSVLYIDGDLTLTGGVTIDLDSQGELDVFVTGNLVLTGAGKIGKRTRPAALRIYVGGAGDIAITGSNQFAANLYAPRSNVFVTGADDIYGSFFVGSYQATGTQSMHYDDSIQQVGQPRDCTPPPPRQCAADLDCPSPLVCVAGDCTSLLSPS
jgi:hypothetical protein